jgi:hypothetical protein
MSTTKKKETMTRMKSDRSGEESSRAGLRREARWPPARVCEER